MATYTLDEVTQGKKSYSLDEVMGKPKDVSWGEVPMQAVRNLPKSAANFAGGVADLVLNPIDSASGLLDLAAGGLRAAVPSSVSGAIDRTFPSQATERAANTAGAVGQFYKDRYGSAQGLRNTLANDPVGALSDASAVLTGGGALASKLPIIGKAGTVVKSVGNAINPINIAGQAITKGLPMLGRGAANIIGGIGTHTGGESIKQAASAGFRGGDAAKSFAENMRGQVPITDALETAKSNLQNMGQAKQAEYRAGMAQVSNDKSVLNFNGIDRALNDAYNVSTFKGKATNSQAFEIQKQIADEVNAWKGLDPAQYHTPEGLDALKKRIGGIQEAIPFEQKTARKVAGNVYNAIKNEINNQAPVYSKTMRQYSDASDQITEIERALSVGGKQSADTSIRKLQSLMRNNANTNYGNRLDLAKQLEAAGGQEFMPALAGQSLNSFTPRGLGGAVAGGLGMGGYALGGLPIAVPTLLAQSPRIMGETAFKVGQGAGLLNRGANVVGQGANAVGIDPATLANYMSIINRQ